MTHYFRLVAIGLLWPFLFVRIAGAHVDKVGPLVVIQKIYEVDDPIGRITIRYDCSDPKHPMLEIRSNLFQAALPSSAILNLPGPDWAGMMAPYSMVSFDSALKRFVDRPYLYLLVPLRGPPGNSWSRATVRFFFDDQGKLKERQLHWQVGIKDGKHRPELPAESCDVIDTILATWPIDSQETAESALSRALSQRSLK